LGSKKYAANKETYDYIHKKTQIIAYEFESADQLLEDFWISVDLTGRAKSNLSRTLKTLERYGIVELHKEKRSVVAKVKAINFKVEFGLSAA
jgi:DNA-binding transcriptional ArsR family regulator